MVDFGPLFLVWHFRHVWRSLRGLGVVRYDRGKRFLAAVLLQKPEIWAKLHGEFFRHFGQNWRFCKISILLIFIRAHFLVFDRQRLLEIFLNLEAKNLPQRQIVFLGACRCKWIGHLHNFWLLEENRLLDWLFMRNYGLLPQELLLKLTDECIVSELFLKHFSQDAVGFWLFFGSHWDSILTFDLIEAHGVGNHGTCIRYVLHSDVVY